MNNQAERARLLRAVHARVPLDAAKLLADADPQLVESVLNDLPPEFAGRIRKHLLHEQQELDDLERLAQDVIADSVIELMEPALAVLPATMPVADAIAFLRAHATPQQITYLYVTDAQDALVGLVVIRDLLLSEPEETLAEVMLPNPFAIPVDMDVGEAIKAAIHRHYPVYPVIDAERRIAGVIRGWRLFERQAMEISAQSGQMVGVDKEERLSTGFWDAFRMRHPWLQVNLLTAFLAGFVVSIFEGTITQIVALAAFLPILAGQSGNTGCQALAITLRGITLGDMERFSVARLVRKEVLLGAMNGLLTGVVAGLAMWWTASRGGNADALLLGGVIVLAMIGSCMMSGMFGVLVPVTLKRFGADPATASSIFLTTGTDIAGMGLMLLLATALVL